jgi:alcohol dehydrogenase class IV
MSSLLSPLEMQRPSIVRFGDGVLATLRPWISENGFTKPFVIADAINVARLDLLGLGNVAVFGDVVPEPDLNNLMQAVEAARDADVIIGFGGGSAMDLAKLVSVMAGQDLRFSDISGPNRAPPRKIGLAQIPTTAGTGSEVGTRALVTDPDTLAKVATESLYLLADVAIIDPSLTVSVPSAVTAATGVDAMAHCVEAFTSKRSHPVIDCYAIQGVELIGKFLKRAVENGDDLEARSGLSLAAFYGGICLGPVNTTAGHAIAYPLGTRHKLPHGIANALIFPHTLAANAQFEQEKTNAICAALDPSSEGNTNAFETALTFCENLGLDMHLASYGVPKGDLPIMAEDAHQIRRLLDWNPANLSVADITTIYERAF